jgi:hypothetical protein
MRYTTQPTTWAAIILAMIAALFAYAAEWHVSPDGMPGGDGSLVRPWDLATGLAQPVAVHPGDVIWLHGGTYRGGFTSTLTGTAERPITVRQAAGERATIDCRPRDARDSGLFSVRGAHTTFWGFEITCSDLKRETAIAGPWPVDIRRGGVDCRASHIRFVNLLVHDCDCGFGFWAEGEGGEISGCLIYHNGWKGPDRGHGHAIYTQNRVGTKRLVDNIIFGQFGYGIHAYGSEKAALKGFHIEGNIIFDNGLPAGEASGAIMVGGGTPVERAAIIDNAVHGGEVTCGYTWGTRSDDVVVTGNYLAGGLRVRDFARATVTGNTLVTANRLVALESPGGLDLAGTTWDRNTYAWTGKQWSAYQIEERGKTRGLTFAEWRTATGLDTASTYATTAPTATRAIVRPNPDEPGRAHIAVFNWANEDAVMVDLAKILPAGARYRIVSAQDIYGAPVVAGIADGHPVRIPLVNLPVSAPIGLPAPTPRVEPASFAAFVVLPD